jgi:hypothetical protein
MQCPVCDADNLDDAVECATCGRQLAQAPDLANAPPLDGLELTRVVSSDLEATSDPIPGLELTPIESDPRAPTQWTPGPLEVDLGREPRGERVPVPDESAICPWCGATSLGALCDACGRRKSRYAVPPPERRQRSGPAETVTCPSCFARVLREVRCSDCGLPFPLQEL